MVVIANNIQYVLTNIGKCDIEVTSNLLHNKLIALNPDFEFIIEQKENSPDDFVLTEGEKALIKLLRRVPAAEQPIVIEKILSALDNQE